MIQMIINSKKLLLQFQVVQKNDETANKAPNVLPELAEWNGGHGNYTVSKGARIVYKDSSLLKNCRSTC